jgi:GNAT superfamily N-acetyltransferase
MTKAPTTKAFTLKERPELEPDYERLADLGWPRFMRQRDELGSGRSWASLFTEFADYQFALCNALDRVVAVAHTVPFAWDGADETLPDRIAAILKNAMDARRVGAAVTALSALAVLVDPAQRGQGLSRLALTVMAQMAERHGLAAFVAPVRPTLKPSYPLTPMDRYVAWTDGEGLPVDPWMRTHAKLGARIVRVMPRSMVIAGTVAEWEEWTGMRFPDPGPYVVPGALQPLVIDRERETGRYEDPNVWMRHA